MADPTGGYRFDFDVVYTALCDGNVVLMTSAMGLIERDLSHPEDIFPVRLPGGLGTGARAELFPMGPKESRTMVVRQGGAYTNRDSQGRGCALWTPPSESEIEPFLGKFETWTETWYVEKTTPSLSLRVRFPRDRRFKTTVFQRRERAFLISTFSTTLLPANRPVWRP